MAGCETQASFLWAALRHILQCEKDADKHGRL
jgi:hypothetical protein